MWVGIVLAVAGAACGRVGFDRIGDLGAGDGSTGAGDGSIVTISDGPDGTTVYRIVAAADTVLNSAAPTLNYGAAASMNIRTSSSMGSFVGVVRFDLTTLPAGTVSSAEVELRTTTATLAVGTQVHLHRVLEPWTEGTQLAGTGVANHMERELGQAWTSAGCGPGSRDTVDLGVFEPNQTNMTYVVPFSVATAQDWLATAATNHGMALVADVAGVGDAAAFVTREGDANAPTLVLALGP